MPKADDTDVFVYNFTVRDCGAVLQDGCTCTCADCQRAEIKKLRESNEQLHVVLREERRERKALELELAALKEGKV